MPARVGDLRPDSHVESGAADNKQDAKSLGPGTLGDAMVAAAAKAPTIPCVGWF